MFKPMYGLKDAPRAWRKKLHQVLIQCLLCRQLCTEPELYCVHEEDGVNENDRLARAKEHNEERQETGNTRITEPQEYKKGSLQCLLSVRVDDTNGIATREVAYSLLKHLNNIVGHCKTDYVSFLHIGMQHEHSSGEVLIHQCVYIDSITPIDTSLLIGKSEEDLCDPQLREADRSVLGAVAWIEPTRAELAVYVQASQRRAHTPRITYCKGVNVVIRICSGISVDWGALR